LRRHGSSPLKSRACRSTTARGNWPVKNRMTKVLAQPLHPGTAGLITEYLEALGHTQDGGAPLFRPVKNTVHHRTDTAMTADGVYKLVQAYAQKIGIPGIERLGVHALRATAATNALDHQADIAKVQEWLGHANIATTRVYDHRRTPPGGRPTVKVTY